MAEDHLVCCVDIECLAEGLSAMGSGQVGDGTVGRGFWVRDKEMEKELSHFWLG